MTSHTPLSAEQLAAIRQRADQATPGPWVPWNVYGPSPDGLYRAAAIGRTHRDGLMGPESAATGPGMDIAASRADLQFVANARRDVPALVDEVERLRAVAEAAEAELSYKFTPYQRQRHFPKLTRALAALGEDGGDQ